MYGQFAGDKSLVLVKFHLRHGNPSYDWYLNIT